MALPTNFADATQTDQDTHAGAHNDANAAVNKLALENVEKLTTAERDALSGGDLYIGRVIYNLTSADLQEYDGSTWSTVETNASLTTDRLAKDANGIFVEVEQKRPDGTLFKKSVLSGGTSPEYTTRTVTFYEADGVAVRSSVDYALTYDGDGDLTQEAVVV